MKKPVVVQIKWSVLSPVDQGSLSSELELMEYSCTVICTKVALCVADLVKYMALHSTVGHCFLDS